MRIVSLFFVTALLASACGGKSKAPAQPEPEMMENEGGEGGDAYGTTGGGYEDDKEPCEDERE